MPRSREEITAAQGDSPKSSASRCRIVSPECSQLQSTPSFTPDDVELRKRFADADQRAMACVAMAAIGIQCAMDFFGLARREAGRDQESVHRIVERPARPR